MELFRKPLYVAMLRLIIKAIKSRWFLFLVIFFVLKYASNFFFDASSTTTKGISRQSGLRNKSVPIGKQLSYVIFDASDFDGNLKFLNNREDGWRVLVVNLADESQLVSCDSCSSLTNDTGMVDLDKWKEHVDKGEIDTNGMELLVAIMLVLSQKATWIYITNRPVPIPYKAFERVTKNKVKTGLVYQGLILEPCGHFIDPFIWNGLGVHPIGNRFNLREVSSHSVYYVLSECFHKDMSQQDCKNSLDIRAPIPYTMPGTFAAVDFKNVLVSNPNAWTLIASVLPDDKENTWPWSQIINLMIQRVLWETQSNIGVLPNVHNVGKGCPTCKLQKRLHQSRKKILANLTRWRCEDSVTVPQCLLKLATQDEFIPNKHIQHLVSSWITTLGKTDGEPIERIALSDNRLEEKTNGTAVHFTPAKSLHKSSTNDSRPPNAYKQICNVDRKPYVGKIPSQHKHEYEGILLIVVFNFAKFLKNIPFMEYTYGRHFKHIIYCSENVSNFTAEFQKQFNVNPVSFIEARIRNGASGQNCMAVVMKMGYNVKGYLQASDDVLINTWNFPSLPYEKPWFQEKLRVLDLTAKRVPSVAKHEKWIIWHKGMAFRTRNAFNQIQQAVAHPINGPMASKFLKNLAYVTYCDHCLVYQTSDIVYVPQRLVSKFLYFQRFFRPIHLEIAFPTIIVGISSDYEIFRLRGNYLWHKKRVLFPHVWTEFDHFHHPFKLDTENKYDVKFYCQQFLARLDKDIVT